MYNCSAHQVRNPLQRADMVECALREKFKDAPVKVWLHGCMDTETQKSLNCVHVMHTLHVVPAL